MRYYKSYEGLERGDFRVIKRVDRNHVLTECKLCGMKIISKIDCFRNSAPKCECTTTYRICPTCGKRFDSTKRKYCSPQCKSQGYEKKHQLKIDGKYVPRVITKTTRMLICVYYAEGADITDICIDLHRNPEEVKEILKECIKSNEYLHFADGSLLCNLKKAKERMREFEQMAEEA